MQVFEKISFNRLIRIVALAAAGVSLVLSEVFSDPFDGLALLFFPLLWAIIAKDSALRAVSAAAFFIPLFGITALCLIELGQPAPLTLLLALIGCAICLAASHFIGIGATSLALLAIPFFPLNPLSAAGLLFPGSGVAGMLFLAVCAMALEWKPDHRKVAGLVIASVLLTAAVFKHANRYLDAPIRTILIDAQPVQIEMAKLEVPLKPGSLSARMDVMDHLVNHDMAVLGENIFLQGDIAQKDFWCLAARQTETEIFIGIQNEQGRGDLWLLSGESCPKGIKVYEPRVTVPWLNGRAGNALSQPQPFAGLNWLSCFEAVSLRRWWQLDNKRPGAFAILYSNTTWAKRTPVALLDKIARLNARLFGVNLFHAQKDTSILLINSAKEGT